jgi:hypothetical protein
MRLLHVVLAGGAVAGLVAAGSAFTASNTIPPSVAGYGHATISGATVSKVLYNPDSTDKTLVDNVVFTSDTNIVGRTATMTLTTTGGGAGTKQYACVIGATYTTTVDVTCSVAADKPAYAVLSDVGLAVG